MKRIVFAFVLLITSLSFASLTDGLVGYWPFDGDVKDYSGNSNHGSIYGVTSAIDRHGNSGRAYYFNGSSYISVANAPSINGISSEITIAAWIKPTAWFINDTGDASKFITIMQKANSSNCQYQFQFGVDTNNVKRLYLDYWADAVITDVSPPTLGQWQFVALTLSNGSMKYYKNGLLSDSKNVSVSFAQNDGTLYIGMDPIERCEYFIGSMDNLAIYNRALSASEIKALEKFVPSSKEIFTVTFYSNGGNGEMEDQVFEEGSSEKIAKNAYTKDGYMFQGWALSSSGEVVYKDEALITVDRDMTLYAVWANPPLTLSVESADWSSGSITLRCTDVDTSGRTHTYTLQYYDESTDTWKDVSSAQSASASVSLPDTDFSSRLGGIPPVKYRVQDENGRVSVECVTRNKYGIFVSPGDYAFGMGLSAYPSASPNYASVFGDLANGDKGKFTKVHVLTGSNAIYHEVDEAFADIGGKIKTGDVCFLYFGTHGGLHQSSTSSVLALYNGYYEEEQLANHIRLLNGVDAGHLNGNDVAIIGFVHACHSKGISDNSHDDAASGGYCRIGSWCVNSVLTSKNTAWITATDNSKALSHGDYFSLFLLNYGWGGGWALESGSGPLSCDKLAKYTKERTDAIFNGLIMKDDDNSYEVKVGVVDPSSILRNIYIGNCGSHSARNAPDNPCITVQGAVGSIAIEFSNIFDADRTILFKRKGEDGTWSGVYGENLTGTFSYADTDVESSGRECPYYYQLRTMNGAGVGVSNIESAWRIHMERHRISFYYDVPNGVNVASGGHYWDLPYDSTLNDIWGNLDEKIKGLGISGYIHTGWYTERNGKGRKISSDERVLVDVNYYADWTAMTQEWLDGHTQVAAVSGGDIATAATMTAANGCRTVGECYALGINPEDPDDDFRIKSFKMDGTKPVVTVNHTEDGSGASLLPRMKMLGKAELSGEWEEVPEEGNPAHRFFTVTVEE